MMHWFAAALLAAVAVAPITRADDAIPIGTATMAADGTITLWLRAELPKGGEAHGTIV